MKEIVVDEDADEEDDADESPEDVDVGDQEGCRVVGAWGRETWGFLKQADEEPHEDRLHHAKALLQWKVLKSKLPARVYHVLPLDDGAGKQR